MIRVFPVAGNLHLLLFNWKGLKTEHCKTSKNIDGVNKSKKNRDNKNAIHSVQELLYTGHRDFSPFKRTPNSLSFSPELYFQFIWVRISTTVTFLLVWMIFNRKNLTEYSTYLLLITLSPQHWQKKVQLFLDFRPLPTAGVNSERYWRI